MDSLTTPSETIDPTIDLYDLLQVSPWAHPDVIRAAFRALARRYHPDVSENPHAARVMRQVNAAYAVLRDGEKRARYDVYRLRSNLRSPEQAMQRTYRPGTVARTVSGAGVAPTRPWRRMSAVVVAALLSVIGGACYVTDAFDDASAHTIQAGVRTSAARPRGLNDLIMDATRLTPGPCGPQFPGHMNPC